MFYWSHPPPPSPASDRSLANHCYDLRFSRPQKATIVKRVKAVAKMEGMDVDDNAAEMLVEANGNDIRQVCRSTYKYCRLN